MQFSLPIFDWIATISIPLTLGTLGWALKLDRGFAVMATRVEDQRKLIDTLATDFRLNDTRLTRSEDSVSSLKDGQVKLEVKLDDISRKLETLPAIQAQLANLTAAITRLEDK